MNIENSRYCGGKLLARSDDFKIDMRCTTEAPPIAAMMNAHEEVRRYHGSGLVSLQADASAVHC